MPVPSVILLTHCREKSTLIYITGRKKYLHSTMRQRFGDIMQNYTVCIYLLTH